MKKLFLTLGLASLFMVACNNTPKQPEQTTEPAPVQEAMTAVPEEKHECPMDELKAEYANWENMTDEDKAKLNMKAVAVFADMDAKMEAKKAECEKKCAEMTEEQKAECEAKKAECEKKCAEMTEEQKAECEAKKAECEKKCAEMKAKWENFATMSVDDQKDLIMERLAGCQGDKPCCKGEEGHKCQHEGEEGHKCQHEGEEGHQCQHGK